MEMAGPGLPYHIRVKLTDFTDNYLLATNKKFPDHRIPEILEVLNSQRVAIDKMDYIARERYYNRLATEFHLNVPSPDQISCKSMLSAQANLHVDVTVGNPSSPDSKRNIGDSKVRVDEVLDGPQTNVSGDEFIAPEAERTFRLKKRTAIQAMPRKKHGHQRFKVWWSNRDCDYMIEPSKHLTAISAELKRDSILSGKKIKLEADRKVPTASVANATAEVTTDDASEHARVKSLTKLQSMNEDEIQDHFSCLERNRATLNPTEKIEMSLCLIHPEHRQSLTIDDLRFIQNHHRAIKIAQILNRHHDIVDVQKMCIKYFPEEHEIVTKLIEDVNILMEGLGYQNGGFFDRTTTLSKELIVNNITDPKNKLIITSLNSSQPANVFKELRHVLMRIGYTLSAFDTVTSTSAGEQKKKRLRKGRSKIQVYKIGMHSKVEHLLDKVRM